MTDQAWKLTAVGLGTFLVLLLAFGAFLRWLGGAGTTMSPGAYR